MTIPSFLLAKLYVKGSLRNAGEGFEFSLKNVIDSTSLSGIGPFTLPGRTIGPELITVTVKDRSWAGNDISPTNVAPVPVGSPILVRVAGIGLPPGAAKLGIAITSADVGRLAFEIADKVE
jgi:hypothetical protein